MSGDRSDRFRWARGVQRRHEPGDLIVGQQPTAAQQFPVQVPLTQDPDPAQQDPGLGPPCQHQDGCHLGRRVSGSTEHILHRPALVEHRSQGAALVHLAMPQGSRLDAGIAPGLHIDDEHPTRADDNHVQVRLRGAGPSAVGQDEPARLADVEEHLDHLRLPGRPRPPLRLVGLERAEQGLHPVQLVGDQIDGLLAGVGLGCRGPAPTVEGQLHGRFQARCGLPVHLVGIGRMGEKVEVPGVGYEARHTLKVTFPGRLPGVGLPTGVERGLCQ